MNFIVHGGRPNANLFTMDGASLGLQGGASYLPLEDAIEEMKVSTPTSDASNGLSGGGVITVSMKSGTNQLHGTFSDFFQNDRLNAWSTQQKVAQAAKSALEIPEEPVQPLLRDAERANRQEQVLLLRVYRRWSAPQPGPQLTTPLLPISSATGTSLKLFNSQGQLVTIFDPLTTVQTGNSFVRQPFPNNVIPPNRISNISQNLPEFCPACQLRVQPDHQR